MNNNYLKIIPAVDTVETGSAYPAVESHNQNNINGTLAMYDLQNSIPFSEEIKIQLKLATKAKFTDLLSHSTFK